MRVLVHGNSDRDTVCAALDRSGATLVIDGGEQGAGRYAHVWAVVVGAEHIRWPLDRKHHGSLAREVQALAMLVHGRPDLMIAFANAESMVRQARKVGVNVWMAG